MRHIIVGTAGHIDHGKTALVRALTGIETDRLEEEKRRGISIELGFAHLDLNGAGRLGFVDVPGHERFVRNMLAGAAGVDLVLLVVAADESIMPQTREHFDICRLLGVGGGVVALTKADLVDADMLDLVRLEVEEFTAGSFLGGAPVVAVSSTTGAGIDDLKKRLSEAAARVAAKDSNRHFRLPVDRSFSMRGFGTVVTGTLIAGSVAVDDEVEAHPGGRCLRVRGIHVHGAPVDRAFAGQRTALNVTGAGAGDLARGAMLAPPGLFQPSTTLDCRFRLLESARPMKHRAPVHFHVWTSEIEAEARLLESTAPLASGEEAFVRFLLREPALVLPGDRFIARRFSPVITIGGGVVVDLASPRRLRRAAALQRLAILAQAPLADRIATLVRESRYGLGVAELVARLGERAGTVEAEASRAPGLIVLREPQTWLLDRDWLAAARDRAAAAAGEFHRAQPLQPGIAKSDLAAREWPGAPPFLTDVVLRGDPRLAVEGEIVRLASHRAQYREDEETALAKIEGAFRDAGLAVPSLGEVLARCGVDPARARALLQVLLRDRRLVRVGDDLAFHASAIAALRDLLAARKGQRFAVPQFKEWTGVSRKYAIPLLEFLDRERVTRRDGDSRIVL